MIGIINTILILLWDIVIVQVETTNHTTHVTMDTAIDWVRIYIRNATKQPHTKTVWKRQSAIDHQFSWLSMVHIYSNPIWVCLKMVYTPNYSHLIGIMISKTIGFRGTQHFQTNPFCYCCCFIMFYPNNSRSQRPGLINNRSLFQPGLP